MSDLDDLIRQIPMDQVAQQLGVSEQEAYEATAMALPALLGGMQANAQAGGGASLADAATQHSNFGVFEDLGQVDTEDGSKAVQHVFGNQTDDVIQALGGVRTASSQGGLGGALFRKLLPILAPLVLSYILNKMTQGGGGGFSIPGAGGGGRSGAPRGGGYQDNQGIPDISAADQVNPGGAPQPVPQQPAPQQQPAPSSGSSIDDILNDVLGGGRSQGGTQGRQQPQQSGLPSAGDILGSILGGLLGGGRR